MRVSVRVCVSLCVSLCVCLSVCVRVLVYILSSSTMVGVGSRIYALNANRNDIV